MPDEPDPWEMPEPRMTLRRAFEKAAATFIIGVGPGAPVGAAVFDVGAWKAYGIGGCIAVANFVVRAAQAWAQKVLEDREAG